MRLARARQGGGIGAMFGRVGHGPRRIIEEAASVLRTYPGGTAGADAATGGGLWERSNGSSKMPVLLRVVSQMAKDEARHRTFSASSAACGA